MSRAGDGPGALGLVLRLAMCGVATVVASRMLGWLVAIVATAPLYGMALARPILGALSGLRHATHARIWRDVQGQHYVYRGQSLLIDEDDEGVRWLRVADVRKLLPNFPRDAALAAVFAERARMDPDAGGAWIHAGALDDYLARAQNDAAVRFKVWLQRSVIHPSPAGRASAPLSRMQAAPVAATTAASATPATTTATTPTTTATPAAAPPTTNGRPP